MFLLPSVSLCVGYTGDSDSESDFELQPVDTVHDGFSDVPSDTSSEERATGDDVETMLIVALTQTRIEYWDRAGGGRNIVQET